MLRPKNLSAALMMDLLDIKGEPLWMSRQRFDQHDIPHTPATSGSMDGGGREDMMLSTTISSKSNCGIKYS